MRVQPISLAALAMAMLPFTAHAQNLNPKEREFAQEMEAKFGQEPDDVRLVKDGLTRGGRRYKGLQVTFDEHTEVLVAEFSSGEEAFAEGDEINNDYDLVDAEEDTLYEVRGKFLVMVRGNLHEGSFAKSLRSKIWRSFPWRGKRLPKSTLISIYLHEFGSLSRVDLAKGKTYKNIKDTSASVRDSMADAIANPDPDPMAWYTSVGAHGVRSESVYSATTYLVTDKKAAAIRIPLRMPRKQNVQAVIDFAKITKTTAALPAKFQTASSAGATGSLGNLLQ